MLKDLTSAIRPAIILTLLFAVLLGLAYPALLTGIGQLAFPHQANGSLIRQGDRVIGLRAARTGLHRRALFPSAPVRGRRGAMKPITAMAPISARPARRCTTGSKPTRQNSGLHRTLPLPADLVTDLRLGARSPHQPRGGFSPGRPRGQGARARACAGPRAGAGPCRDAAARLSRRAARECADAQSRTFDTLEPERANKAP